MKFTSVEAISRFFLVLEGENSPKNIAGDANFIELRRNLHSSKWLIIPKTTYIELENRGFYYVFRQEIGWEKVSNLDVFRESFSEKPKRIRYPARIIREIIPENIFNGVQPNRWSELKWIFLAKTRPERYFQGKVHIIKVNLPHWKYAIYPKEGFVFLKFREIEENGPSKLERIYLAILTSEGWKKVPITDRYIR